MADAAKQERATAKGTFTRARSRVISAMGNNLSKDIVQSRFEMVKKQWNILVEKNENYLQLKYPNAETPDEEEIWYNGVADAFEEAEIKYDEFLRKTTEEVTNIESTHALKEAADAQAINEEQGKLRAERMFKFELQRFNLQIAESNEMICNPKATLQTLSDFNTDLKKQLNRLRESQREVILCGGEVDSAEIESNYTKTSITIGSRIEELSNLSKNKDKTQLKLDRIKLPTFSGQIREFPRFKNDFQKQVMPTIEHEAVPYVLKSCLSGDALNVIKNVDDDAGSMWERLNERYGRPSKVTDAIMWDIKKMRQINEGDDKRFSEMVDLVESSFRDLKLIGMQSEISNTTVVSFIEEKLPKSIKSQWCLEVCEDGGEDTNKFTNFLKFLLKHKRAIEYGSDQMRASSIQKSGQTHLVNERKN